MKLVHAFVATTAMTGMAALPAVAQDYYAGKTIKVIVGLSPGGTSDTFIRTFTEYWQKYIPGQPTVIVENMPGSGNLLATNHVYEAVKPDGLTLVYGPWDPIAQLLGSPELRADYSKFEFVGASSDIRVNYIRKDVAPGIAKPADIANAGPFNLGGSNPTGFADLLARMSFDLIGAEHNYVTGYPGGNDLYAATLRNEVQAGNTSYGTLVTRQADFVAEGGPGLGLWYFCTKSANGDWDRKKLQGDIPCFVDLYKEIHGSEPSGELWNALDWYTGVGARTTFIALAPPGTPPEALDALREGFYAAAADPALQEVFIKRSGLPVEFVPLDEGRAVLASLATVSEEIRKVLAGYVESGSR